MADLLRSQGGQSLILALAVMFLLVFIGGLFIGIVGRNIIRSQRSGEVLSVQYLAEAGIRYADHQLTYSDDGADWRPVPDYPELVKNLEGVRLTMPPANELPDPNDPDYTWLMQGFSRYSYGKGRFLLKVAYQPRPDDPMSKFIKIESIGRMGVVDLNDPTTYQNKQPIRLRKELVAYKPIAITDYARFITNKDRVSSAATLGAPDYVTAFGQEANAQNNIPFIGAPIRVNGDLIWHGRNFIWLDPARGQGVEVAGDIRHEDSMGVTDPVTGIEPIVTEVLVNSFPAVESNALDGSHRPAFNTTPGITTIPVTPSDPELGWYRDGNPGEDIHGRPREIMRLEPPNLDSIGVSGRLSRYRELTRNSGEWRQYTDPNTHEVTWYNTGYYGWGEGIYIDNTHDVQPESIGYTLRADWTQPGSSEYWHGPYYDPPGITVELLPYDINQDTLPDIRITRDENARYIWNDRDGNPLPETGEQIAIPYPKNGVLFAEGNVCIKGMLAPGKQLTVVSGHTIYVDGSILKYRDPSKQFDDPTKTDESCSIALLAEDFVCVNTTQFFGPLKEVPFPGPGSGFFDVSSTSAFWFNFAFGEDANTYMRGNQPVPVELFVRHTAAPGGASYMNMLVNWPPTDAQLGSNPYYSFYDFHIGPPWETSLALRYVYPLGDPIASPDRYAIQQHESWEHQVFGLWVGPRTPANPGTTTGAYDFHTAPGVENRIGFQLDQSQRLPMAPQDYYISRAAIQPMDIRIEALMYAQNKSFFVIPGEWFNTDPDDLLNNPRRVSGVGIEWRWPFYGQPLDVRITVFGAISENMSASVGDTSAWMEKWGWIPIEHGNSTEFTSSYRLPLDPNNASDLKRKGLTIIYDDLLSHPVVPAPASSPQPFTPLRRDVYGRPLPIAPKLPVSPQILYTGKPT